MIIKEYVGSLGSMDIPDEAKNVKPKKDKLAQYRKNAGKKTDQENNDSQKTK